MDVVEVGICSHMLLYIGVVRDFIEEVAVQFCTATFFLSVRGCKAVSKILPLHPWEEC